MHESVDITINGETLPEWHDNRAKLVIIYSFNEGTGFDSLYCDTRCITDFPNGIPEEVKGAINMAARILTDKHNIETIYRRIINNMLHVPVELRNKPN